MKCFRRIRELGLKKLLFSIALLVVVVACGIGWKVLLYNRHEKPIIEDLSNAVIEPVEETDIKEEKVEEVVESTSQDPKVEQKPPKKDETPKSVPKKEEQPENETTNPPKDEDNKQSESILWDWRTVDYSVATYGTVKKANDACDEAGVKKSATHSYWCGEVIDNSTGKILGFKLDLVELDFGERN